ncbi:MAG: glyoxalase superfamily protein [Gammaproteobacteria bacterium]|nr:VOC family protein [Pseudomonadales bacterium]MCP5347164.1 VOC family protein [Pseudomonadales bacterium]
MTLGQITPIFRIFDEHKAREFYLDYLGFDVVFEYRFEADAPLYMGIVRDACRIHLTEHYGDCCPGGSVRVESGDLDAYLQELTDRQYKYYRPSIEEMPWGSRDMKIIDPFGNRLIFTGLQ